MPLACKKVPKSGETWHFELWDQLPKEGRFQRELKKVRTSEVAWRMFSNGKIYKYLKIFPKKFLFCTYSLTYCSKHFLRKCIHQGCSFLLSLVEKATIRPAKSMDSLCSVPVEGKISQLAWELGITAGGVVPPHRTCFINPRSCSSPV